MKKIIYIISIIAFTSSLYTQSTSPTLPLGELVGQLEKLMRIAENVEQEERAHIFHLLEGLDKEDLRYLFRVDEISGLSSAARKLRESDIKPSAKKEYSSSPESFYPKHTKRYLRKLNARGSNS